MNVRDFLFNFVCANVKICILKTVNGQILFYGRAEGLDRIEVLNRPVECVAYDTEAGCLIIKVRNTATTATYHLPTDLDYVY